MAPVSLLWWSLLKTICLPVVLGFPSGDGWEWMSGAARMDGAQFMDFSSPLVQMSANAYRYPSPLHDIPGWSLSSLIAPLHPSHGGAQALAYEENPSDLGCAQCTHNPTSADMDPGQKQQDHSAVVGSVYWKANCLNCTRRVIVAFRGTQISTSIDSVADACADKLLWEGFDMGSLPSECSVFDSDTLDYFAQSLNYTLEVISLYPSVPILLTGHSLGAGLAVLVAGALSHIHTLPVIGFGAPATRKPLFDRGLSIESLENGSIIVIGHEWDVIMRTQMEGQIGLLCFYPQEESSSCKACLSSSSLPFVATKQGLSSLVFDTRKSTDTYKRSALAFPLPPGDCMDCFFETHYLKNLIAVVNRGDRPLCHQASDAYFATQS